MSELVSLIILVQVVKDGSVVPAVYQTFELWILPKSNSFCARTSQIMHYVLTHCFLTANGAVLDRGPISCLDIVDALDFMCQNWKQGCHIFNIRLNRKLFYSQSYS